MKKGFISDSIKHLAYNMFSGAGFVEISIVLRLDMVLMNNDKDKAAFFCNNYVLARKTFFYIVRVLTKTKS